MVATLRRAALIATLAIGACGGESPGPGAVEDDGIPQSTLELVERAKSCGVRRGVEVVNQGLALAVLPERSYAIIVGRRSFGFEATAVIGLPIRRAFDETRRRAATGPQRVERTDYEGFEAEVFLADRSSRTTVFLRTTDCDDLTQAVVRSVKR